MELRDFIVTPIIILLVYVVAYVVRPYVTNDLNRRYFLPALTARICGAVLLGILYQFYYGGGDTFNYHTHGSRIIWETFINDPAEGIKLVFTSGGDPLTAYRYSSKILFFADSSSYFIVRVAAIFDFITFSTYSATAVLFSVVSFIGAWAFYLAMCRHRPDLRKWIAFAVLFIPSVIFWGSGILKDTITFASLGLLTYAVSNLFNAQRILSSGFIALVTVFVIYSVKKYILFCFFPAVILWFYATRLKRIKSTVLKVILVPFIAALVIVAAYYSVLLVSEGDTRYSLDRLAETAKITAYDIGYYSGRDAGSGYSLGELDGTFSSMLVLTPQAINVSLFRPYIWEVKNPLMLLSALESIVMFGFMVYVIAKKRFRIFSSLKDPMVMFCLVFSLTFAFAVGISTYNFGTLSRYKIPLMPYFALAMIFILFYENKDKNVEVLESTE